MKKLLLISITTLLVHIAFSQTNSRLSIHFAPYYNKDDFRWSIAGDEAGKNPNILSELIYNPVKSTGIEGGATIMVLKKLGFHIDGRYGTNFYGKASDADYEANDRQDGQTAYFHSNDGYQYNFNVGLNFSVIRTKKADISLHAGYHLSRQLYKLTSNELLNLNARYKTKWQGFYAKINGTVTLHKLQPFASFKLIPLNYYAVADWNLRDDFQHPVSFEQDANGIGYESRIGIAYNIHPKLAITTNLNFGKFYTNTGKDIAYLTDATPTTQMNGATRKFIGAQLGLTFSPF